MSDSYNYRTELKGGGWRCAMCHDWVPEDKAHLCPHTINVTDKEMMNKQVEVIRIKGIEGCHSRLIIEGCDVKAPTTLIHLLLSEIDEILIRYNKFDSISFLEPIKTGREVWRDCVLLVTMMIDISGLSDEAKSAMLARAMGWIPAPIEVLLRMDFVAYYWGYIDSKGDTIVRGSASVKWSDTSSGESIPDEPLPDELPNLYEIDPKTKEPKWMPLAWRVLNWAHETALCRDYADGVGKILHFWSPSADAQRAWLDKILELAIEAGLAEVPDD